jgi:hypothetical protein
VSARTNAGQAAAKLRRVQEAVRLELARELQTHAQRSAAVMRQEAPKSRSTLANSIGAVQEDRSGLSWYVYPTVDYAGWIHKGRKPGKGLPRFFDSASASIVAWLEARIGEASRAANPKWRKARLGSKRRTAAELELRDRYMALSRAVKLRGIKANPFVTRTAEKVRQPTQAALADAVRRGVRNALRSGAAQP